MHRKLTKQACSTLNRCFQTECKHLGYTAIEEIKKNIFANDVTPYSVEAAKDWLGKLVFVIREVGSNEDFTLLIPKMIEGTLTELSTMKKGEKIVKNGNYDSIIEELSICIDELEKKMIDTEANQMESIKIDLSIIRRDQKNGQQKLVTEISNINERVQQMDEKMSKLSIGITSRIHYEHSKTRGCITTASNPPSSPPKPPKQTVFPPIQKSGFNKKQHKNLWDPNFTRR